MPLCHCARREWLAAHWLNPRSVPSSVQLTVSERLWGVSFRLFMAERGIRTVGAARLPDGMVKTLREQGDLATSSLRRAPCCVVGFWVPSLRLWLPRAVLCGASSRLGDRVLVSLSLCCRQSSGGNDPV